VSREAAEESSTAQAVGKSWTNEQAPKGRKKELRRLRRDVSSLRPYRNISNSARQQCLSSLRDRNRWPMWPPSLLSTVKRAVHCRSASGIRRNRSIRPNSLRLKFLPLS